jgi:hypothetical protein
VSTETAPCDNALLPVTVCESAGVVCVWVFGVGVLTIFPVWFKLATSCGVPDPAATVAELSTSCVWSGKCPDVAPLVPAP